MHRQEVPALCGGGSDRGSRRSPFDLDPEGGGGERSCGRPEAQRGEHGQEEEAQSTGEDPARDDFPAVCPILGRMLEYPKLEPTQPSPERGHDAPPFM